LLSRDFDTVLSSEGVSKYVKSTRLDFVFTYFDSVFIHIYFRPRSDWVVSHYAQKVKTGEYRLSPEDFVRSKRFDEHISLNLQFSQHLASWRERVGSENVYVHFLSPRFGPPEQQFIRAMGIAAATPDAPPRNASLSVFELCVLASMPRMPADRFLAVRSEIRSFLKHEAPFEGRSLLTAAVHEHVTTRFRSDTEELVEMQGEVTREDLEPDRTSKVASAVSFDEIRASDAFDRLRKRLAAIGC
jgi:hypothetical protein